MICETHISEPTFSTLITINPSRFIVPLITLSPSIRKVLRFGITFLGDVYVLVALATLIYAYGGYPFLKGFINELRKRSLGMTTLVAVAISVAYVYGSAIILGLPGSFKSLRGTS